jgi:hypothetical protein
VALVPEQALGADLGKYFVLVLSPGNKVQYRSVVLGRALGETRIVTSGLNPGDKIVTAGLQKVKPGDVVTPRAAANRIDTAELANLQPVG